MKKQSIKLIIPALFSLLLNSCTNDSLSDLTTIDDIESATYTQNVKPIIDNNCIFCHGSTPTNGAPMSLTTYTFVKQAVINRGLLDRISRAEGTSGAMPFGGPRLSQTNIDIIIKWNTDGLQE